MDKNSVTLFSKRKKCMTVYKDVKLNNGFLFSAAF